MLLEIIYSYAFFFNMTITTMIKISSLKFVYFFNLFPPMINTHISSCITINHFNFIIDIIINKWMVVEVSSLVRWRLYRRLMWGVREVAIKQDYIKSWQKKLFP